MLSVIDILCFGNKRKNEKTSFVNMHIENVQHD